MTAALSIARWHNHYRSASPLAAEDLARWDAALTELDLADELSTWVGPDEWVAIRKLELRSRINPDLAASAALIGWRQALRHALQALLADSPSERVVRYPSRRLALADLLYRSACGDTQRHWAWQQMGLASPEPKSCAQILEDAIRQMAAEPEQIWPVLGHLIQAETHSGALGQLLRALSPQQWHHLLSRCPQTAPYLVPAAALNPRPTPVAVLDQLMENPLAQPLVNWLKRRSGSPLPASQHLIVCVLLATAQLSAQGLSAASLARHLAQVHQQVTQLLAADPPREPTRRQPDCQLAGTHPELPEASAATPRPQVQAPDESPSSLPAPPELPLPGIWAASHWAGLAFVINLLNSTRWQAALADLPEETFPSADCGLQLLWQLGRHLGVPASDAALRAFCGGWQPHGQQLGADGELLAAADLAPYLQPIVADLHQALAQKTDLSLDEVCQRQAQIHFEPGWIQVHFTHEQADVRLRRVGLDLDPGWLPWLGCVLRFVYD